jgi:predicted nucleotidyltransferase
MNNLHEKYLKVLNSWINKTLKDDSIELIILSGSVARGDETKHSDIDIAVYYKIKIPKSKRLFYKYKTVYIEQTNYSIKELNLNNILIEHKILFDKEGYTKNLKFDKTRNKLRFLKKYRIALKNLKLAKKYYNKQDYDKAILHILGTQSFTFITVHALPELFDLPTLLLDF